MVLRVRFYIDRNFNGNFNFFPVLAVKILHVYFGKDAIRLSHATIFGWLFS